MTELFKELLKVVDNEYGGLMEDDEWTDTTGWVDTGSYSLNALFSGSIYGGFAGNKSTALAGEPSTGKTFYALESCKHFLDNNEDGRIFYFETEGAISKSMLIDRGIDVSRFVYLPVNTVQDFRTQALKLVNTYMESKEKIPVMLGLDSLGNLSTDKEMEDIATGKDTRDMTRAQLIRGAFRVLRLKLGISQIPLIVTNHVYDVIGSYVPLKKMSGGSGLDYAADQIAFLSKKKAVDKNDEDNNGVVITATLKKSRFTIENKKIETLLYYQKGLDRYYGLVDLGVKFGMLKKVSTKIQMPDGSSHFQSHIEKEPEKYFDQELLDKIDAACKDEFLYGKTNVATEENE